MRTIVATIVLDVEVYAVWDAVPHQNVAKVLILAGVGTGMFQAKNDTQPARLLVEPWVGMRFLSSFDAPVKNTFV